jgi:hypothetical protein
VSHGCARLKEGSRAGAIEGSPLSRLKPRKMDDTAHRPWPASDHPHFAQELLRKQDPSAAERRMLAIPIPTRMPCAMGCTLVVALGLMTAALGGCATSLATDANAPLADEPAAPMTSPALSPGNVFLPSPGLHYHGSGGP